MSYSAICAGICAGAAVGCALVLAVAHPLTRAAVEFPSKARQVPESELAYVCGKIHAARDGILAIETYEPFEQRSSFIMRVDVREAQEKRSIREATLVSPLSETPSAGSPICVQLSRRPGAFVAFLVST